MSDDPRDAENDRHGYAVYAVFAVAGQSQVAAISEIRRAMIRGRPDPPAYVTAPAHVTVKRLFAGIETVAAVQAAVHAVAERTAPFRVLFEGDPEPRGAGASGLAVPVSRTPELIALNAALEEVVGPLAGNTFGASEYRPHMTVFQDASPDEARRGRQLARGLSGALGAGFRVETLELMARTAPFLGGRWHPLGSFDLDIWGGGSRSPSAL